MIVYVIICIWSGVINEVHALNDREKAVEVFEKLIKEEELEIDSFEDNFLDREEGMGFYTDGEQEGEVHLRAITIE